MSETRYPDINGETYRTKVYDGPFFRTVKVLDPNGSSFDPEFISIKRQRVKRFLLFGGTVADPIEKIIQEALNNAVCKHEDKAERQEEYNRRIEDAIGAVEEIHENNE